MALVLAAGAILVAAPLGSGRWDPRWLRVAERVRVDPRAGSTLEPGQARAPFRAEQRDRAGRLLWRLRGPRVLHGEEGLMTRVELLEPHLEVFGREGPWTIQAGRGILRLPREDPEEGTLALRLEAGVRIARPGLELRAQDLDCQVQEAGTEPRVELRTASPVDLETELFETRWRLKAAGLDGDLSRGRLELRGPLAFRSGWLARPEPLAGQRLEGTAQGGAVLERLSEGASSPPARRLRGKLPLPAGLRLRLLGLELRGQGLGSSELAAKQGAFDFVRKPRAPAAPRAALGGAAGVWPAWGYALARVELMGAVRGAFQRPARPLLARRALGGLAGIARARPAEALDLTLSGEMLRARRELAGAWRWSGELSGSPARLAERGRGLRLASPELRAAERPEELSLDAAGPRLSFALREPPSRRGAGGTWTGTAGGLRVRWARPPQAGLEGLRSLDLAGPCAARRESGPGRLAAASLRLRRVAPGLARLEAGELEAVLPEVERGRRARPWRVRGRTLVALLQPARLRTGAGAAGLVSGELAGDVWVERLGGDPRRARRVVGERLVYRRAAGRLELKGSPARVRLGRSELEAPAMSYRRADQRLDLSGGLVLRSEGAPDAGDPAGIAWRGVLRAAGGWARLSAEPSAWEADRLQRKRARRRGRAGLGPPEPLLLPAPLRELELWGRGRQRLVAQGPGGFRAEGDWLRLGRGGLVVLGALPGAPPARVAGGGRELWARRCAAWRLSPSSPFAPEAAWLWAEGPVELGAELAGAPLSSRCDWALASLRRGARAANQGGEAQASTELGGFALGGGDGVDLRFAPRVKQQEGRAALVAGRLRGNLSWRDPEGRPGALLLLDQGWRGTLGLPTRGPARVVGERLRAVVDPEVARGGLTAGEDQEAFLRRVLRSLHADGGVELAGEGLQARAREAELDTGRGVYRLRGDPAVLRQEGIVQEADELDLDLSE